MSQAEGASITLRELTHRYGSGRGMVTVLRGLDLDVGPGEHVALTGVSGAGKSTLLALVGGLERPQEGGVTVAGQDLARLRGDALAAFRHRTVGFVFQHFGLLDLLSARENVELAMALGGTPQRLRRERATELLAAVDMGDRLDHYPARLSGGERQRVAIARALANRPGLILADEPTGNLDGIAAGRVLDLLERLRAETGCTLLIVTHNPAVARRASVVHELVDGRLRAA